MLYLRDNLTNGTAKVTTSFELVRELDYLIFNFVAEESKLYSYSNRNNDDLWKGSVCEVFLDLGDDFYYEFEVAPNGATFIAKIKDQKVSFCDSDFFLSTAKIEGSTYFVSMTINLSKLKHPKRIRYNAFRVETPSKNKEQILSALNPTLCSTFHVREKFIPLDL